MSSLIQVFIGTKAQYIKTAPLLRLLDERQIPYRLIDSGQHAQIAEVMRRELGVREPDVALGGNADVVTIGGALLWAARLATRLVSKRRLIEEVFGGSDGVCVVHGDTPSTLLSALMAWRAGLKVAHLEAGLRSGSVLHPFPEELIRIFVMRFADVLFAPTPDTVMNLERFKTRGEIVPLPGNTSIEAVREVVTGLPAPARTGAVVTMHRVENLRSKQRTIGFVELVESLAQQMPVTFVVHGPTRQVLERSGALERLTQAGVVIRDLVGHREFIELLWHAKLAVVDGGSIQEECAYLGLPTLLWRERSERPHGIGRNVVVSEFDTQRSNAFISDFEKYRQAFELPESLPSEIILETLVRYVAH